MEINETPVINVFSPDGVFKRTCFLEDFVYIRDIVDEKESTGKIVENKEMTGIYKNDVVFIFMNEYKFIGTIESVKVDEKNFIYDLTFKMGGDALPYNKYFTANTNVFYINSNTILDGRLTTLDNFTRLNEANEFAYNVRKAMKVKEVREFITEEGDKKVVNYEEITNGVVYLRLDSPDITSYKIDVTNDTFNVVYMVNNSLNSTDLPEGTTPKLESRTIYLKNDGTIYDTGIKTGVNFQDSVKVPSGVVELTTPFVEKTHYFYNNEDDFYNNKSIEELQEQTYDNYVNVTLAQNNILDWLQVDKLLSRKVVIITEEMGAFNSKVTGFKITNNNTFNLTFGLARVNLTSKIKKMLKG